MGYRLEQFRLDVTRLRVLGGDIYHERHLFNIIYRNHLMRTVTVDASAVAQNNIVLVMDAFMGKGVSQGPPAGELLD
jgi:hypothetical protein